MAYVIDVTRHQSVFSPEEFGNKQVCVIGAGATGSKIVLELAKLGVKNIVVYDFDHVEEHNLANQVYGPNHLGMAKVEALAQVVLDATGLEITARNERVTADTRIAAPYVFLLVDTIEARKEIAENCLLDNISTRMCFETRMGVEIGYVVTFNPNSPVEYERWMRELPTEAQAETSACGTSITVGATAAIINGLAVWQFIKAVRGGEPTVNHLMFAVRPFIMMETTW